MGKNRAAFRSESPRGQSAPREDEGSLCAGVAGERDARKRRRGRRGTAIESRILRGRVAVRLASCAGFRPSRQAPPAGRGKGRCLCGGVVCRSAHNLITSRNEGRGDFCPAVPLPQWRPSRSSCSPKQSRTSAPRPTRSASSSPAGSQRRSLCLEFSSAHALRGRRGIYGSPVATTSCSRLAMLLVVADVAADDSLLSPGKDILHILKRVLRLRE